MFTFPRITKNPAIMGGKACVRDTRVTVAVVLELLASGKTPETILDDYSCLEREDISQALSINYF